MFIDELEIFVQAGKGGNGCVSFRREKYVPLGGPDGGDGGSGGSVILRSFSKLNTLLPLRSLRHYRAGKGVNGKGANRTGAKGDDLLLEVPVGTIVRDRETGTIMGDLTNPDQEMVIARGGRGGKGNRHFASASQRAPKFAQPGEPGQELWLKLELKLLADVGLVGFPNAGKSTLISRISSARPKIADYPFTTLQPNLGVVSAGDYRSFVVADIPGIIPGASHGAGLGLRFLKHIERTSLLLILVDPTDVNRGVRDCYRILRHELHSFSDMLSKKPILVAFTKADVPDQRTDEVKRLCGELQEKDIPYCSISSVSGEGIDQLVFDLFDLVQSLKDRQQPIVDQEPTAEDETQGSDPLDEI